MTAATKMAPGSEPGIDQPSGPSKPSGGGRIWAMMNPDRAWRDTTPWTSLFSQFVLIVIASTAYFAVRGFTKDQATLAFSNARRIVEFEQSIGLNLEASAQGLILENDVMIAFFNWVYMFLHWPVIVLALAFTFLRRRQEYVLYRDAIIFSGLIGLLFFALFPVAPPRLFDTNRFFDSVAELSQAYKILQPKGIVNQFAALPSFHVGWNLLAGVALFRSAQSLVIRTFAVVSPSLMTLAVVLTANHWVIDVFAGTGIALVGLSGAAIVRRRSHRTRLPQHV